MIKPQLLHIAHCNTRRVGVFLEVMDKSHAEFASMHLRLTILDFTNIVMSVFTHAYVGVHTCSAPLSFEEAEQFVSDFTLHSIERFCSWVKGAAFQPCCIARKELYKLLPADLRTVRGYARMGVFGGMSK